MRQADLERALAEQFDVAHLSVYADHLQALGDPRGDLIALDLQRVPRGDAYQRALHGWLGNHADALRGRVEFRYGFVSELVLTEASWEATLDALAASPAADYVLRAVVTATRPALAAPVAALLARPHPWLQRLAIAAVRSFEGRTLRDPPAVVDAAVATRLGERTPRLDALEVTGEAVIDQLDHPTLRALRIATADAVRSLLAPARDAPGLPGLRYLDFCLASQGDRRPTLAVAPELLSPAQLPGVTRLDLIAPGDGYNHEFELLAALALRHQLRHARIPSLRLPDPAPLTRFLDDVPQLTQLAIRRLYQPPGRGVPSRVVTELLQPIDRPAPEISRRR